MTNLEISVGLILVNSSGVWNEGYYSHDLSKRIFILLPRLFNSRRVPPLLNPISGVFPVSCLPEWYMVCVHFENLFIVLIKLFIMINRELN